MRTSLQTKGRANSLDNKARSLILFTIGVILITISILLGLITGSQALDKAKQFDIMSALGTYFVGLLIAAVLMAIGVVLAYLGTH